MTGNKPLNPTEQETLAQDTLRNQEFSGKPATEFKESAAEIPESGGARETEVSPGTEITAEPGMVPVRYAKIAPLPEPKPAQLKQIEGILSENIKEAFLNLSPDQQIKFKQEGEKVADSIFQMLESAKIKVKKIVDLIS
ncbi:MAG: hypothetical protein NTU97_03090, partial [Candidatus Magasanikbacteria bacterium]|nr:hypothetical protein [Candidatus Magasanikbacteria bacterium]